MTPAADYVQRAGSAGLTMMGQGGMVTLFALSAVILDDPSAPENIIVSTSTYFTCRDLFFCLGIIV